MSHEYLHTAYQPHLKKSCTMTMFLTGEPGNPAKMTQDRRWPCFSSFHRTSLPLLRKNLSINIQHGLAEMSIGTANQGIPARFVPSMILYHLLPLHMPLTLFFLDAPFGRFSNAASKFKVNGEPPILCTIPSDATGNTSWFIMEIISVRPLRIGGSCSSDSRSRPGTHCCRTDLD